MSYPILSLLEETHSRRYRLPRLTLTPDGEFTPVSSPKWSKRIISVPQLITFRKMVPVFMHQSVPSYGEALVDTTMQFYDSTDRPLDRRTYDVNFPDDLVDLSVRFMAYLEND